MKAILLAGAAAAALGIATAAMAQTSPAPATAPAANILLADWSGPYEGLPPWDRVRPELFPEAFQVAIDEQRREIAAIADNPAAPTFANTVEALDRAGRRLDRVQALFGVMTGNMSNPQYQALQREWGPRLAAAADEIVLNPALFQRIRTIYEARASSGLDPQQQRVVTRRYEAFVRRGANLNAEQKQRLSAYNQQLARLFAEFSEKVLKPLVKKPVLDVHGPQSASSRWTSEFRHAQPMATARAPKYNRHPPTKLAGIRSPAFDWNSGTRFDAPTYNVTPAEIASPYTLRKLH